jgi:3-hydroxyacyl-CoA dehydrogenase
MKKVDFVVEAVTENEEVKTSIFRQLDKVRGQGVAAATPSSAVLVRLALSRLSTVAKTRSQAQGKQLAA